MSLFPPPQYYFFSFPNWERFLRICVLKSYIRNVSFRRPHCCPAATPVWEKLVPLRPFVFEMLNHAPFHYFPPTPIKYVLRPHPPPLLVDLLSCSLGVLSAPPGTPYQRGRLLLCAPASPCPPPEEIRLARSSQPSYLFSPLAQSLPRTRRFRIQNRWPAISPASPAVSKRNSAPLLVSLLYIFSFPTHAVSVDTCPAPFTPVHGRLFSLHLILFSFPICFARPLL